MKKPGSPNAIDFQHLSRLYKSEVERRLTALVKRKEPASVYEPLRYVIGGGGKRLRAILVLLSCEAVGGKARNALDAAAAIEILHNFTLVHDDVMDHATVRRGRPTMHKKWDENVAILAGDELVALAYRSLLKSKSRRLEEAMGIFTEAFVEVCEGQGLDKEFEARRDVHLRDYLLMIRKKTATLIAASAEIGAVIGGGTWLECSALRKYGEHLGRAFQIKDDLLDIEGTEREFGKTIGADMMEGKKTYVFLKALELVRGEERVFLLSLAKRKLVTLSALRRVQDIYDRAGVFDSAREEIARSTEQAKRSIGGLRPTVAKEMLLWLSCQLLRRSS